MKKVLCLVLSVVLLLSLVGNTSFAQSVPLDENVIYKADEITDINLLFERAKNGVTDENIALFKDNISIRGTVSEDDVIRHFSTTQKLLEVRKNNESIESFKTVSFVVVSKKHNEG